jgi:alanyl-tRNA synthetase
MQASEIRRRFLDYFVRQGHAERPSSSLVPGDDPTLLFTNAGMVQFKKIFLGLEEPSFGSRRATTSQKCVRAGGKHNDLEQVGHTARHHTFFEMLGNFSFGDYFKRDAIRFAWEFVTGPVAKGNLGMPKEHLRVSVFAEDDEARALWREIAGLPDSRIYGLGAKDNFWQMADTGPCGPCSEIYIDLAHVAKDWSFPAAATGEWTDVTRTEYSTDAFVEGAEAGRFLEFWNLVFMQFDRQADGTLMPLPKPSVDTGAGLERISAVMQGVTNNYHTDVFTPIIKRIGETVGVPYRRADSPGASAEVTASFHVIADHARAVAFLLADGVFPSNEGRGYVLRRILRRAVRYAWLLGRREPTLVDAVATVIEMMGDVYSELRQRGKHIVETTRAEEERFLTTIGGGMTRFDEIAPARTTQERSISGEDAFRLYDTFGFPIDLTELMARERGYTVDIAGFEAALDAQRRQSQEERKSRKLTVSTDELTDLSKWESRDVAPTPVGPSTTQGKGTAGSGASSGPPDRRSGLMNRAELGNESRFVGYDVTEIETQVTAVRHLDGGRVAIMLRETPFYAESGGQISDQGEIVGTGWRVDVDEVRKIEGRNAAVGTLSGAISFGTVTARIPADRRKDTERHHTATHLLHAALRQVLGEAVHQAGSLVAPDRLRFDFTHHGPVKPERLAEIEALVNREIWKGTPLGFAEKPYQEAVKAGAMALFGEKYGDVVRVVSIPGFSMELCGGTHVKNTAEIGLCRIVSETGVAAGVRRIEALCGPHAFEYMREHERTLVRLAEALKSPADGVEKKVHTLLDERRALEKRVDEATRGGAGGGGGQVQSLLAGATSVNGARIVTAQVAMPDVKSLQALGDALREQLTSGVGVLASSFEDGKNTLLVVVTDDLRDRGVRADLIIKDLAAAAGGKGGGKPHMAQAGIPDAGRIPAALERVPAVVRPLLEHGS